jgi:hypothetical protein
MNAADPRRCGYEGASSRGRRFWTGLLLLRNHHKWGRYDLRFLATLSTTR